MKFVLLYELSNREFDNLVLLKRELVRRGHTVEICSKFGSIKLLHEKFILFAPNAYCNEDINFYRYVYNTRDNAIVVYPCEQVINRQMPEFFDLSENNCVKYLPTFCWGRDFYDFLQELGYKNQFTTVVGPMHLDFCRERFDKLYDDREKIARKYNLPIDKKWILFISDFVFSNVDMGNRFIHEGSLSETTVIAMRRYESELQKEILGWFDTFLKNNHEYIIIYRKHPSEIKNNLLYSFEKEHKNNFFEISEMNIKQWIVISDRICTYNSTAFIECAAANKNCLLLRPQEFPQESVIKEYPFYIGYPRIKTERQFCEKITLEGERFEFTDEVRYLYDIQENFTYERLADVLEKIAEAKYKTPFESKCYQIKRIKFLLANHILPKVYLKLVFRKLGKLIGYRTGKESILATKEWVAAEKNIQQERVLGAKIDEIIL